MAQTAKNVVKWPHKTKRHSKPPPLDDAVFFNLNQVVVGTALRNAGRLERGSIWKVTKIVTHKRTGIGTYKPQSTEKVTKLNDDIHLYCEATGERRTMLFSTLSYSAIWRLA